MNGVLTRIKMWFGKAHRFEVLDRWMKKPGITVLDIGCGGSSPQRTKAYFPECRYYGIDLNDETLQQSDFDVAEMIVFQNLETDFPPPEYQDRRFSVIILNHVIEHIASSDELMRRAAGLLEPGGVLYIECPAPRSIHLPSMAGTLNFHDDPTHIRLWPLEEITAILTKGGLEIRQARTRRSLKQILLLPIFLLRDWQMNRAPAHTFWDITGFAHYVLAERPVAKS
ncbi:MAG: class I SAM-dependent methyltransferase [Magnetococcus sp. WYHC-3]